MSLFSGAGGLDLGFIEAGFDIAYAMDNDPDACETYRRNIGDHIEECDAAMLRGRVLPQADVVVGGPPCQGFSVAGHMDPEDPRSQLIWEFVRIIKELQPRAFVLENVKALAELSRWMAVRAKLMRELSKPHYNVQAHVLNARDFGVPQSRERVFFIGTADGTPPVTFVPATSRRTVTVREILEHLPRPGTPPNIGVCQAKVTPAKKPVLRRSPFAGMLFNGQGRPIDLESTVNTLPATMGGNRTPIVDEEELREGKPSWAKAYHARLIKGLPPVRSVPPRLRRLTVTEAALLQTFPPGFQFVGRQTAQFRQIGNAVPPKLAQGVAAAVMRALEGQDASAPPGHQLVLFA